MDKVVIYDANNEFIIEGRRSAELLSLARDLYPDRQLVGEGQRTDGTTYGFIVSKGPAAMGM